MNKSIKIINPKLIFVYLALLLFLFISYSKTSHGAISCKETLSISKEVLSDYLRNEFIGYLKNENYSAAEKLLFVDQGPVIEEVKNLRFNKDLSNQWSALNTGAVIQTPLSVLKSVSDHLNFKPNMKLIDLGSGHGDPALVFGSLNPELEVVGYDIVEAKVNGARKSAKKLGLKNVSFIQENLAEIQLPFADYYYLFNPVNESIVTRLAKQIKSMSKKKNIKVIIFGKHSWTYNIFKEEDFEVVSEVPLHMFIDISILEFRGLTSD